MATDKRFLVFGYPIYYPTGGMTDLLESFFTLDEAKEFIENNDWDQYQVYDRIEGLIVYKKKNHSYF